jgi:hypothetical protein
MKIERQGDEWVVWRESDKTIRFIFDNEQDALSFMRAEDERVRQIRFGLLQQEVLT